MIEIKHIERIVQEINDTIDRYMDNSNEEDKRYLDHWKTYFAMAIMDDLGKDTAYDVANIIEIMHLYNG